MSKQVRNMFSEHEIELWYLGLPFEETPGNDNGASGRKAAEAVRQVDFPPPISDDEVNRLFLGLPLRAA